MPPEPRHAQPVVIIGGGWAGLAAAIHLCAHDVPVTLIDAAQQLGGRARTVMFGDTAVDNGQHIALGAYRHLLELLQMIGADESRLLVRVPLSLTIKGRQHTLRLRAPRLPAPLHLLWALLSANGLTRHEKIAALTGGLRLMNADVCADATVSEWLSDAGQPAKMTHYLWTPLCIAALNTRPDVASARVFQRVLHDAFMRRRADSDLLLPRYDLGRLLPEPAQRWLIGKGARVVCGKRVTQINVRDQRVTGVTLDGEQLTADKIIIATAPRHCARLIAPLSDLQSLRDDLRQLRYHPITTVYLKYRRPALLTPAMLGLVDSTTHWLFDRRLTGHAKIVAAVISADGAHATMNKATLTRQVIQDIKTHTPLRDEPLDSLLIREKHATFSATPAAEQHRPGNDTRLRGCWLAGDYTATGYPATLEGAIISGKQAAARIRAHDDHQ